MGGRPRAFSNPPRALKPWVTQRQNLEWTCVSLILFYGWAPLGEVGPLPFSPPPPWLRLGGNAALHPIHRPGSPIGTLAGPLATGQVDIGLW